MQAHRARNACTSIVRAARSFSPKRDYSVGTFSSNNAPGIGLSGVPTASGLYNPELEKDACGVGFVTHLKGKPSRKIVEDARDVLVNMTHRGAALLENGLESGDGAGILTGIPEELTSKVASRDAGVSLPKIGEYATGLIFMSPFNPTERNECKAVFTKMAAANHIEVMGWRKVQTYNDSLGETSRSKEPHIEQVFIKPTATNPFGDQADFERGVYRVSRLTDHAIKEGKWFYICSLSTKTIVYKGQLTTEQLFPYFEDLQDPDYQSHIALVHSRFSTNTFPSWDRAQPLRFLGHNGEINTVRGNRNWMRAREGVMASKFFTQEHLEDLYPIIDPHSSDSGSVDNAMEFLLRTTNKSLPEIMMMMVPEAWENQPNMDPLKRDFYNWSSFLMEPWDGPALFAFSDGRYVGSILDRNGLRPSRYSVTSDDIMVMASEIGVVDMENKDIVKKGRLQPGRMLLVDTQEGIIVDDEDLKRQVASEHDYGKWVEKHSIPLSSLVNDVEINVDDAPALVDDKRLPAFGYTFEQLNMLLQPMAESGKEAMGSMGNDAPLACMSDLPKIVPEYFKQLFAQVTNPPIDPFREAIIMSLRTTVGPVGNLLNKYPEQCRRLILENPILTVKKLEALKNIHETHADYKTKVIDITFDKNIGKHGFLPAMDRICAESRDAIAEGYKLIVLSDRAVSEDRVPISTLIATGAVHQFLVNLKLRTSVGLIVESGEAREVHHHTTLMGFGADAICPYLALEILYKMKHEGALKADITHDVIDERYIAAVGIGFRKVMAKMGISTLQAYKGAQIFEALGLGKEVVDRCFTGAATRIGGMNFDMIAEEALARHNVSYGGSSVVSDDGVIPDYGEYHWRIGGEYHINEPAAVGALQNAVREQNQASFRKFTQISDEMTRKVALRGLLSFNRARRPVNIDEVEPASEIVRRFVTGAMSYGSISAESHESLAIAMNKLGGKSNTGEGGEDPKRYKSDLALKRSAIKQVASGRFGVTIEYLSNADEIQIKMAQGAKPGEGGELNGNKVTDEIGATRHSTPGVGLISPPPHHDIYSIEDLAQLILDLKCCNPSARISVKLVSEVGVGVVAAGVAKAKAEHILVSGHDGGTGASSWTGVKHAGLPWELGLAETHQTLVLNDLRGKVVLQTDGNMRTGRDVVIAAMLGAEEYGFSTAPLIALGCTMMRKCHLNTCPVGIATQDPYLRAKFAGAPEHVINYFFMMAEDIRGHMASLGFTNMKDMVGRADLLSFDHTKVTPKMAHLDLSPLLTPAWRMRNGVAVCNDPKQKQNFELEKRLEHRLLKEVKSSIQTQQPVRIRKRIGNLDRVVGATISHHIAKRWGYAGLPENTIQIDFKGTAGQTFGGFLANGVTLRLIGDTNDYCGKGLSGGKIVVRPDHYHSSFVPEDNIIIGNVGLYGATSGSAFFRGRAAERFCVRNSGALAVVEGVGDHGCEYMTGGRVLVLGETGRNFAAGMSGGIAYVYDPTGVFPDKCNTELVSLVKVEEIEEKEWLQSVLNEHYKNTDSGVAQRILADYEQEVTKFVKVYPDDYRRVLESQKKLNELKPGISIAGSSTSSAATQQQRAAFSTATTATAKPMFQVDNMFSNKKTNKRQFSTSTALFDEEKPDKVRGFMKYKRATDVYRSSEDRIGDWGELQAPRNEVSLETQSARCMDCGVPFCQSDNGCPIGNKIPNWNDLVYKNKWQDAIKHLHLTNNFPEFTGRACPAPCEGACVLGINEDPVSIKSIENAIIDHAWDQGWIVAKPPKTRTGKKIAIIGSGPAGLAAADQLNKVGHSVTIYERNDRAGGLLMYGIPNMKLDKSVVERRINLMIEEGVVVKTGVNVGRDIDAQSLVDANDAVLVCVGSTVPRDINVPGRKSSGIHFAMDFLEPNMRSLLDEGVPTTDPALSAKDKHVVVIGGGDTGTDCVGTALRQGAKSVLNFEIVERPPQMRDSSVNPWPLFPRVFRTDYGHEENILLHGKDQRDYSVMTEEFLTSQDGRVTGVSTIEASWIKNNHGVVMPQRKPETQKIHQADMVLLAMGFTGPERYLIDNLGLKQDARTNIVTTSKYKNLNYRTGINKVYAAGDCRRGQSLIVWGINEGRQAAREIDIDFNMGQTTLPYTGGVHAPVVEQQEAY